MGDLELFKKLNSSNSEFNKKLESLQYLRSRIETEIFMAELYDKMDKLCDYENDLSFVKLTISEYSNNILYADQMLEINRLNKKYKRGK